MKQMGTITHYMRMIGGTPLLSREEEVRLARAAQAGCKESRDRIVLANLRLVVAVAKSFQGRALPLQDIISEGNTGLIHAINKFDVEAGYRFSTYAVTWIRERIQRALVNQGTTIRVAVAAHGEFVQLHRAIEAHMRIHGHRPTDAELAATTGLKLPKVRMLLGVAATHTGSVEEIGGEDFDFLECTAGAVEMEPVHQVEQEADAAELKAALACLSPRERQVIVMRFWDEMTLEEVGLSIGKTRERVRQIQMGAMAKLRRRLAMQRPAIPPSLQIAAHV
jgi:RNA polymerase nonessential primary-like sigma factor